MVQQFMDGIDSGYRDNIVSTVASILTDLYPDALADALKGHLSEGDLDTLKKTLEQTGQELMSKLMSGMHAYQHDRHVSPIIDIVEYLPKEDLAAMAESLVNLTSLKRHVTREAETVGGPIDVALISKGDGFIWIKRKHYFSRELNPYYFAKYYQEASA